MANLKNAMRKMRVQYESQNAPDELHQRLQTLISENARPPKRRAAIIWLRRIGGSAAAAMLALCIAVNASPDAAALLADIPVLGQVVRIFSFREYQDSQNGIELKLSSPHISGLGDSEAEERINTLFDEYADKIIAQYEADVAAVAGKEEGHISISSSYSVPVDSDRQLTVAIDTTIIMASSQQCTTYYNIDKQTGELVPLSGLFKDAHNFLHVSALSIECLVGICSGTRVADCFPFTHNGVCYCQFSLIGIPTGTAGREHVVFSVTLEDGGSFAAFLDEVTGIASARSLIIVSQFADVQRCIVF